VGRTAADDEPDGGGAGRRVAATYPESATLFGGCEVTSVITATKEFGTIEITEREHRCESGAVPQL
jgi:hypothetical protein